MLIFIQQVTRARREDRTHDGLPMMWLDSAVRLSGHTYHTTARQASTAFLAGNKNLPFLTQPTRARTLLA